jgi:DNA-binding protein YbaB
MTARIVEIEIRDDGKVVWVHINGQTEFRACEIEEVHITDNRKETA